MSETFITVRGRAANKPELHNTSGRTPMAVFRVGANPRYFDRSKEEWVDGRTEWYSVMAFGNLAMNAAFSIGKGDPVVVYGRFRTSEWQPKDGGPPRLSLELVASSIGHDLRFGATHYARMRHDEQGRPAEADGATSPNAEPAESLGGQEQNDHGSSESELPSGAGAEDELVPAGA